MRKGTWFSAIVLVAILISACADRGEQQGRAADTTQAAAGDTSMPGMPGMQGMQDTAMMRQMQSHMIMMQGMSGDSMKAMLPQHRQMLANMIAQLDRQMRAMNMAADTARSALADSLRQDLVRMPDMNAQVLHALMPEHNRRVMRLMEMHRGMMKSMRM